MKIRNKERNTQENKLHASQNQKTKIRKNRQKYIKKRIINK